MAWTAGIAPATNAQPHYVAVSSLLLPSAVSTQLVAHVDKDPPETRDRKIGNASGPIPIFQGAVPSILQPFHKTQTPLHTVDSTLLYELGNPSIMERYRGISIMEQWTEGSHGRSVPQTDIDVFEEQPGIEVSAVDAIPEIMRCMVPAIHTLRDLLILAREKRMWYNGDLPAFLKDNMGYREHLLHHSGFFHFYRLNEGAHNGHLLNSPHLAGLDENTRLYDDMLSRLKDALHKNAHLGALHQSMSMPALQVRAMVSRCFFTLDQFRLPDPELMKAVQYVHSRLPEHYCADRFQVRIQSMKEYQMAISHAYDNIHTTLSTKTHFQLAAQHESLRVPIEAIINRVERMGSQ